MQRVPGSPFTPDDRVQLDRTASDMGEGMPSSYKLKGMFFTAVIDRLGRQAFEEVRPELLAPPQGRYLAFHDYPMWDHQRLTVALAQVVYRGLPEAEAMRRMARDDIRTLGSSTLGKVVMAMVGDARSALLRYPLVYDKISSAGWSVRASEPDERSVALEFEGFHGPWAYQLGQVEGIVAHYGSSAHIDVFEDDPPSHFRFIVTRAG